MLLALLVRLPFQPGIDADIFVRWSRAIQAHGLTAIYDGTGVDHGPVAMYFLAVAAWIAAHLPPAMGADDRALVLLLKLPAMAADLFTAALIVQAARAESSRNRTLIFAAYALNPAVWYVAAYWTQDDAPLAASLVLSLTLLMRDRVVWSWLVFAVALGIKTQSAVFGLILMVATAKRHGWSGVVRGVAAAGALGTAICLPWLLGGQTENLIRAATTLQSRLNQGAFNLWYLVTLGAVHLRSASAVGFDFFPTYANIAFALWATYLAWLAVLTWRQRSRSYALAAAVASMSLFMFAPAVHERYLFPAIAFLLLAAVERRGTDRVVRYAFALVSMTLLFNLMSIVPPVRSGSNLVALPPPYSATVATLKVLAVLTAAINVALLGRLTIELWRDSTPAPFVGAASSRDGAESIPAA